MCPDHNEHTVFGWKITRTKKLFLSSSLVIQICFCYHFNSKTYHCLIISFPNFGLAFIRYKHSLTDQNKFLDRCRRSKTKKLFIPIFAPEIISKLNVSDMKSLTEDFVVLRTNAIQRKRFQNDQV